MVSSRSSRSAVLAAIVVLLAAGGVWAAKSAKPSRDRLLGSIPTESLFCVRINTLDGTLAVVDEFLEDIAPESFDAKAEVLSKLGKLLGNEDLRGVSKKGNFAVFGVNVPGEPAGRGPMGNMFIGALVPVRKYDSFISRNENCGEPDDQGISTITVDGRPQGLATNFRRFALLCPPNAREKLIRVKEMMGRRKQSLAGVLDDSEKELAATAPVWLYVNVQAGSKLIGPILFAQLEQMKAQLQKMQEKGEGPPIDASGVVNFYGGIFKMLINGTEHVMVGLSPTSDKCSVTIGMKPVPGTDMAEIVGGAVEGDFDNMLGYLDDGAMMNLGFKIDRKSLKATYVTLFDLMGQMTAEGIPAEDLQELKNLTTKAINAVGDSLVMSFGVSTKASPAFSIKYVIEVRNEKALKQVIEKELQMMREGALARLYKGFGMEMDIKVERDAGTYKGVQIDAAKVAFNMGDEDSPQSRMLKNIWGDWLDYRWAFVDGYCVYSIGGDTDATIRELIDRVKAGGPQRIGAEMKAALEAIPGSSQADAVGTFNYVRMLNMVSAVMVLPGGVSFPKLDVPSTSNIAFAGRTTADGKMMLEMVLPKKHLLEIKSAFETLTPQLERQQREMRKQQDPER